MYQDLHENFFNYSKDSEGDHNNTSQFLRQQNNIKTRKIYCGCLFYFTDSDDFDQLASFDTDSSFWVCDNLATGHIYNNKALFMRELIPSIFDIGSATGTQMPTLMGTVILRITDDEGEKHLFALNSINYLPGSPVNLLSLRQLAKLYPDYSGYPDKNGTVVCSGFDSHTMFWD